MGIIGRVMVVIQISFLDFLCDSFFLSRFSRLWTRTVMVFSASKNLSLVSMSQLMEAGVLHEDYDCDCSSCLLGG